MNIFNVLLVQPITNGLVAFYQLLTYVHVPYALGFAIILMTLVIRFILYPFTRAQLKTSQQLQKIQPHLAKIKEKHKNDMKMQQQATMALYKEHGVNPAAGCLPGIVQIVVLLFGFYPAIREIIALSPKAIVSTINHMVYFPVLRLVHPWDTSFFGLPLAKTPAQLMPTVGFLILLLPLLTGVMQFVQSKMMLGSQPKPSPTEKKKEDDFATTFQKQSLFLVPIMITYFSYQFPVGLSLYWNTFTVFAIVQQYLMLRENKKSAIIPAETK
jgi:YidC/Oxa1 family membrane protein insertase